MKLRLLLLLLLFTAVINAQEPYRSLLITEVRIENPENNYVEVTNMGDSTINLGEFRLVQIVPWMQPVVDVWTDTWVAWGGQYFTFPEKMLAPGETFLVTTIYDFKPNMYNKMVDGFESYERPKQFEIYDLADLKIHMAEKEGEHHNLFPNETDSVSPENFQKTMMAWMGGKHGYYLEHHYAEGDSAVVDQVNGVFDGNGQNSAFPYDVAGVAKATANSNLIRKFNTKQGNLDFANARGIGLDDSEWIPVQRPEGYDSWRDLWWTVGNHGANVLDEKTLESDLVDVDFSGKTITVPWGTRRLDGIMRTMKKKPGIAWNYHLNGLVEDSLYRSARNGDQLSVYVCGDNLNMAIFDIVVEEPAADANIVIPVDHRNLGEGRVTDRAQNGKLAWPRVTEHESGTDTITGTWFGLPNALRTDSLLKYLEKPSNASWEFEFVDGVERADLKDGDKLKVKASNGNIKEYYIQVRAYGPSHNATLASITWPDIPDFYKGIFGWTGDTIPNFGSTTLNYVVQVPLDVEGIPALVAKTAELNAKVNVKRATTLYGSDEDKTVTFTVTAEDDSVMIAYNIKLEKEKDIANLQPYYAEPFISEFVFQDHFAQNFVEIKNPGNQPLDLSDYMFFGGYGDPGDAIAGNSGVDDYAFRYVKYVPGYKWVSEADWAVNPGTLVQDLAVPSIVQPGDVFVMGHIQNHNLAGYPWHGSEACDVIFGKYNFWDEVVNNSLSKTWWDARFYVFKIVNDSIKQGLKPANDANDFELIDSWGMADGTRWIISGNPIQKWASQQRKPEIHKGNPTIQNSFGTNTEDSEWLNRDQQYWKDNGVKYPGYRTNDVLDLGKHFMYEVTSYKSTVSSVVYKVSQGYSMNESIKGPKTGTTVGAFLANIVKADENQSLSVNSINNGANLAMDALLSLNDTLVVLSADSTNTSKYIIDVSENGLSSNAVLTSTRYDITIEVQPKSGGNENAGSGKISGFEYGTSLKTIIANITVPLGASVDIVDGSGAYVPIKMLNYDTTYVNVTVNSNTYFEVNAEDGATTIIYQLIPETTDKMAFVTSVVYTVQQKEKLVKFVPRGTNANVLISNLVPSLGASLKIIDKYGMERQNGSVVQDDKIVVTSADGSNQVVYHLSMLRTQYVQGETTYLAYVLSNVYAVNQVDYEVEGPTGETTLTEFYARITPAEGATAVVVDKNGEEKSSGVLASGDMLKVSAADGKVEVIYKLIVKISSSELVDAAPVEIYPNPTNGKLNITGIDSGNRIQVFNSLGSIIYDLEVNSRIETISLKDQPTGMYLIVISNNDELIGRFKAIRK